LALFSAGAGEGDYGFALAFFPLSMCIATYLTGTIALPSIVLAFIQFPIYGAVLGYCATVNRRVLGMAVVLIAIVHLYAFMLCASSSMFS
jgi:hypothetical protein